MEKMTTRKFKKLAKNYLSIKEIDTFLENLIKVRGTCEVFNPDWNIGDCLVMSFDWSTSPQGWSYWHRLFTDVQLKRSAECG